MEKKVPTYLLDDNYYSLVDRLAIEVEKKINTNLIDIINSYMDYLKNNKMEQIRSQSEYGLEILYIGILYISYSKDSENTLYWQLDRLCGWLDSTKEFDEIVERYKMWLAYWLAKDCINQEFPKILEMVKDFLELSEINLARYTIQVPEFISKANITYKDRDDKIFVTRHRNEYYINMIGAQILNHVFQEEFHSVDKIYVFVPGCMAAQLDKCKAEISKIGYTCRKCTDSCPINLTSRLSEKYNAKTVIVYHNSELYSKKVKSDEMKYGVVGIACVLNLISGGLKAKKLGYIPQCVLLNYCGCKQHWNFEGLVTDINRKRLEEILFR